MEKGGVKEPDREKLDPERGKVGLSILFREKFVMNVIDVEIP
jgi:hypothetical protein